MQKFKNTPRLSWFQLHIVFLVIWLFLFALPTNSNAQKVNIIVVAIHGVETAKNEWQPTFDYLQTSLPQHEFHLIPLAPDKLDRIKNLIALEEIDFVITQPAIYVDLELRLGVSRILTMVKKGGYAEFGSTIITRSDSKIYEIADLKGKIIAGVAALGFGGWLVGHKEMLDHKFDPYKNAESIKFLGTQPEEIHALLAGQVDAAVIRTGVLEKLSSQGKIDMERIRVLAQKDYPNFNLKISTPLYPEWAFAKTQKASNELSKSVALSLLALESGCEIAEMAHYQQWTFPYNYQPVHELLKTLQVGPYEDYGKTTITEFVAQHLVKSIIFMCLLIIVVLMMITIYRSNIILSKEKNAKEKALEEMRIMATHDSLTKLPNRMLFMEFLEKMVHDANRRKSSIAVMFIDLDRFKEVNDNFGHNVGDDVLCMVGDVLTETIRVNDVAARLGGDEFIVAFSDTGKDEISQLVNRLLEGILHINLPEKKNIGFGASIGAIYGVPGQWTAEQLLKLSDQLMYGAKKEGGGSYLVESIPVRPKS